MNSDLIEYVNNQLNLDQRINPISRRLFRYLCYMREKKLNINLQRCISNTY